MADAILKPIQNIGRAIGRAPETIASDPLSWAGSAINPAVPLWKATPKAGEWLFKNPEALLYPPLALWGATANALFPEQQGSAPTDDPERARRLRTQRLNAMAASLAAQESSTLSSLNSENLFANENPELSESVLSRRDTILTKRQMPGRSQTILSNPGQRY